MPKRVKASDQHRSSNRKVALRREHVDRYGQQGQDRRTAELLAEPVAHFNREDGTQ